MTLKGNLPQKNAKRVFNGPQQKDKQSAGRTLANFLKMQTKRTKTDNLRFSIPEYSAEELRDYVDILKLFTGTFRETRMIPEKGFCLRARLRRTWRYRKNNNATSQKTRFFEKWWAGGDNIPEPAFRLLFS